MPAVGALAHIGVLRGADQHAGVIALGRRGALVAQSLVQLLHGFHAHHDAGHGRARERVADALHRCERHPEGRRIGRKQPPACIALHHRDGGTGRLGPSVQAGTYRLDAVAGHVLVVAEQVIQVLRGGHHVESRVEREHDDLDLRLVHREQRHLGVVGGKADVANAALGQKLAHVSDEVAGHDGAELVAGIHVVDHADLHMIGTQPREQVVEGGTHQRHIAGAHVLAVLPGAAHVSLDDPLLARRRERLAQRRAHGRVAHPAVDDVYTRRRAPGGHGVHLGLLHLADPLGPEPDDARLQSRAAQLAVFHGAPLSPCLVAAIQSLEANSRSTIIA